ncbi:hypothetical protein D3C87_1457030 [compost metagenome]
MVDLDGRLEHLRLVAVLAGDRDQSRDVLSEARAPPAGAGIEEALTDTGIEPDAARHLDDVRTDLLAEVRDLVGKGDLGGKEGVSRVLDHLGRLQVGGDERHRAEALRTSRHAGRLEGLLEDGRVELAQHGEGFRFMGSHHDAIGVKGVADR